MAEEINIEEVLGEPIIYEFSENTLKIRRNLLLFSAVAIFVNINGLIIQESNLIGFKLEQLDPHVIDLSLFAIVLYQLVHFAWNSWDRLLYWRLRLTGTRLAHVTTGRLASSRADYPNDPKQSTLYSWWQDRAQAISRLETAAIGWVKRMEAFESSVQSYIADKQLDNLTNINHVVREGTELSSALGQLARSVDEVRTTLESERIPASLKRFDEWFWLFQKQQIARLFLLEWLVPVTLAAIALILNLPI